MTKKIIQKKLPQYKTFCSNLGAVITDIDLSNDINDASLNL